MVSFFEAYDDKTTKHAGHIFADWHRIACEEAVRRNGGPGTDYTLLFAFYSKGLDEPVRAWEAGEDPLSYAKSHLPGVEAHHDHPR